MPNALESAVARHYRQKGLLEAIAAGLKASGGDPERPDVDELAPVDEFHTAGRLGTEQALAMTPLNPGMHVLDAGCGLGGTARLLARDYGCRVSGIDLTPDFVEVARKLTARTGLAERCDFRVGSVLAMPYEDSAFDAAVTFHVAMNIEARDRFYGEVARVLKPGAPFCIFDVMKGETPGLRYPVPWAEDETTSFLKTPEETCDLLRAAGFEIVARKSLRDFAIDYFTKVFAKIAENGGPPPLGLHLLTGANTKEKFENVMTVMVEKQTDPAIVVAKRR